MKWLPLPKIAHGIAIYPFNPSTTIKPTVLPTPTDDSSIHTNASSSSDHASTNEKDYSYLISLEVGDELFIIEQQGQWYRGYVICPLEEGRKPNKAPIGIFPRSHVSIKEYIDIDPDEADTLVFRKSANSGERPLSEIPNGLPRSFSESFIVQSHSSFAPSRPSSFGDLNFDLEPESNKSVLHIPPPPLPLARFDQSTITGSSEPLVDEIAACVSEWNSLLYCYINKRHYNTFNTVRDHINYLFQARRQLLDQALSREELVKLRKEIVQRMVSSNMDQHLEIIIRHPEKGYLLDTTNASICTIYRMHWKYAKSTSTTNKLLDNLQFNPNQQLQQQSQQPQQQQQQQQQVQQQQQQTQAQQQQPKGAKFYHLFFELKAYVAHICQVGEYTELYFALYSVSEKKFLTEQFVVTLNYNGMPKDESQIGKLQSLFVDLSLHDMTDNLYLVCHIVKLGNMKSNEKDHFASTSIFHSNKHQTFQKQQFNGNSIATLCRRPFGCAVLELKSLFNASMDHSGANSANATQQQSSLLEHDMSIYTSVSESNYTNLHEDIIFNNTKEFQKNPKADLLRISIRTFYGFLDEVLKTNAALLQDVPHTLRLGFADVVFPDDKRNELYVKLESGDFTQFNRSRNIQVTMCVRDNKTGDVIENAISIGAGTRPVTFWESMIMYHEQRPKWSEMIKINMPDIHQWERSHVFVTVKHKSSSFNGSSSNPSVLRFGSNEVLVAANEKIISIGFLPLFLPPLHRDFVADGVHTLHLYKYDKQCISPKYYLDNTPWCARSSSPSNMLQQNIDYLARVISPTSIRKLGHQHSPSNQSFKSANGSFASSIFPTATSASNSQSDLSTHQTKLVSIRDSISLSTFLCSTQFTQNKTLVKLLNWRTLMEGTEDGTSELLSVLDQFTFVGEVEVVKFLGDIFDALLDILVYPHDEDQVNNEINDQVLAAIIWLLGIVQDRRFSNFRPVLDVYIDNRFSIQDYERQYHLQYNSETPNYSYRPAQERTYEQLIKSLCRVCTDVSKAKLLRSSMKVWDYLFRFIVRSRLNQQQKEDDQERVINDNLFKQELEQLLKDITWIMSTEQPNSMIGTQTLTLQHFADILKELHRIFTPQQVVEIAVKFVDACSHVTGRLVGFKLAMILTIVKGPTFNDSRFELAKNVIRWIRLWINGYGSTAKDVIFARQVEQQELSAESSHAQTRLPRGQWVENLRLSLTIMSEVLDKVRKSFGMASSGLSSSCISSPSVSNYSRPTSFATSVDEEFNQHDLNVITEVTLQLVPQLLNAYRELQKMTIQAMHVSNTPVNESFARPHSRQSFSILRERASSIGTGGKNPLTSQESLGEIKANGFIPGANASTTTISGGSNVVLQALSTSPSTPFPNTYPFQPRTSSPGLSNEHIAMITTGLLDLTVIILELFYLTPKQQWITFIKKMYEQDGIEETSDFLRKVVYTCMGILFGDNIMTLEESTLNTNIMSQIDETQSKRKIPDTWLNLSTIAHQIVLCDILDPIKSIFELPDFMPTEKAYTDDDDDDDDTVRTIDLSNVKTKTVADQKSCLLLWRVYFVGFLRVIGSPKLEVAEFMPQAQRAVWKIIGNMRGEIGAKTFLSLWNLAGRATSEESTTTATTSQIPMDYFGITHSPDYTYFSDDSSIRKSMASIEEVDDDEFNVRNSVRIGPTDEVPLSSIHEENYTDSGAVKSEVSFLQADLSYFILSPLCAVSLTLHDRVRSNAISVIADIIAIELYSFGELGHIQHTLISTLDRLVMSEEKGDDEICSKMTVELINALEKRLQTDGRTDLIEVGLKAVDSLCKFLGLLLQIRSLPMEDDEFMDERITATLKLMKFIQVIEREEIYIKYVHQLVQLHLDSRNFIEAALTLMFHADLLSWDPTDKLGAISDLGLPAQSSFHRKEGIYTKMITYLDQGSAWELCIKLCKELSYQYESTLYDYSKLSEILHRQATLSENIVKKERCFTEYFRVGFYGRGFPASNRNRQYIYRGLEWEKMPSFVERMQNRHPNAQLLPSKISNSILIPEEQLKELESTLDGQYLQITSVTPVPELDSNSCLSNPIVPDGIKKYYYFNNVSKFSFSRPVIRPPSTDVDLKQPESDFLNLWTEKVDFECEDKFPTIVRRSKILHSQLIVVSPIENAVTAMENKNKELISLERKYSAYLNTNGRRSSTANQNININPFSMSLNGAVDAPVNGGVPLYKKAFLSKAYWEKNPEMRSWIHRLQDAIHQQVQIIKKCLDTHNKLVSAEMRPFHTTLTEFFHKNFADEIKSIKEKTDQEALQTEQPTNMATNNMISRRRSTISSSTTENGMEDLIKSRQSSTLSQTPGIGGVPILPQLPVMSPISRAFSIRTPVSENSPGFPPPQSFEHATMSRAESLSRTLKMSLRSKKSRKKSTL
ncbi:hypothetical protein EDC94DRAFT_652456 [Helicostylum pulchrum]|nr:hypothetical protein EDC94DRAFT_652456 [Helicostylum pulchrum]